MTWISDIEDAVDGVAAGRRIDGTLDAMRLLVRNLDRSTTEDDLRDLFETFGPVQSCTIVVDGDTGRSKGFGFIEMPKPGEAKAAVLNLNGTELDGARIRVKKAQPKTDTSTAPDDPSASESGTGDSTR